MILRNENGDYCHDKCAVHSEDFTAVTNLEELLDEVCIECNGILVEQGADDEIFEVE